MENGTIAHGPLRDEIQHKRPVTHAYKDGTQGAVQWQRNSIFGIFTATDGRQFSVVDIEVKRIPN